MFFKKQTKLPDVALKKISKEQIKKSILAARSALSCLYGKVDSTFSSHIDYKEFSKTIDEVSKTIDSICWALKINFPPIITKRTIIENTNGVEKETTTVLLKCPNCETPLTGEYWGTYGMKDIFFTCRDQLCYGFSISKKNLPEKIENEKIENVIKSR